MEWLITNIKDYPNNNSLAEIASTNGFSFYLNQKPAIIKVSENEVLLIEGYILPRLNSPFKDIIELIRKHGWNVKTISDNFKGFFNLIFISESGFHILNDHLGHSKYFIYSDKKEFIITNNIKHIAQHVKLEYSYKGMVSHVIFNRFVDDTFLFENIRFSKIAECLNYSENNLSSESYFDPANLANQKQVFFNIKEMSLVFQQILNEYLNFFKPGNVSVPLTGGFDCRTIVAAMLNTNYKFQTYTYSHPESSDNINGSFTAKKLNIPYNNYFMGGNVASYEKLRNEILCIGNGIISSHRAHRLYAIKEEAKTSDIMFVGYLGGESIRGLWPDDLILSKSIRFLWENKNKPEDFLLEVFQTSHLNFDKNALNIAVDLLSLYNKPNENERYFNALISIKSHLHYAQDLILFNKFLPVINFYTDIDYLEMLFASPFNLFHQNNMSFSKLKKINAPFFQCSLINQLNSSISKIQTGKGFSPDEFLRNKWKVILRKGVNEFIFKNKNKAARNFEYGQWYFDVLKNQNPLDNDIYKFFKPSNLDSQVGTGESKLQHITRPYDFSATKSIYQIKNKNLKNK